MSDTTVYILCGLPFAGKTNLARALSQRFRWLHVEVDAIAKGLGIGADGRAISEADWQYAFDTAYRDTAAALENGTSVVFDATNFDRAARDRVRAIARRSCAAARVIYVATPAQEVDRRREHNRRAAHRDDVPDTDFDEVTTLLEPPTDDDSVLWYDAATPIEDWIVDKLAR